MNLEARQKLISWLDQVGHSFQTETAIPLDMYFAGNDEECCIITSNIGEDVSAQYLYSQLLQIRDKQEVESIFVRFYDYQDALEDDDIWINSDTIWIVTKATHEQVSEWVNHLCPSDVHEEEMTGNFVNSPKIPEGYRMIAVWWD